MFFRDLSKKRKYEPPGFKRTSQRKDSKHKGTEIEQYLCVQKNGKTKVIRAD